MTPLVQAVCKALPQYSQKDIEGVLPQVQAGNQVTLEEAVSGVRAALKKVQSQPCKSAVVKEDNRQDYIARVQSILDSQPEPTSLSRRWHRFLSWYCTEWEYLPERNQYERDKHEKPD